MPVFRSRVQGEVLAETLLRPTEGITITDLARRVGAPLSTVHDEVSRLVTAGILAERAVGRSRVIRSNTAHPAVAPLAEVVALTFGPPVVVADEFASLPGVERVMLFGSWAARLHGEPGPPPNDVDVLVVGTPSRDEVYAAADRAERRLLRAVNPVLRRSQRGDDPLVREILAGPHLVVVGGDG